MPAFTDALGTDGALVRVEIGVGQMRRRQLFASLRPVPSPRTLTALIDTGAEITCIDPRVAHCRFHYDGPAAAFTLAY